MGRSKRPLPKRLGFKLSIIRKSLSFTLEEMVKALDSTSLYPSNISEFEQNKREPTLFVLLAYSRLVGISTDLLIDDDLELPQKLKIKAQRKYNKGG